MTEVSIAKKPRFFYGYYMLASSFFCLLIQGGYNVYSFSLFVSHLQRDLGWSRSAVTLAYTISQVIQGCTHPISGRLVGRFAAGKIIAVGAVLLGLGFTLQSRVNTLWMFYADYAVIGVGLSFIGPVPQSFVISNWFSKRRGTMLGIMAMGIGFGGFVLARIIGSNLIPNMGWRSSYLSMGLFVLVLIPLGLFFIKARPSDKGLLPDGVSSAEAVSIMKKKRSGPEGVTTKMAIATSAFWLMCLSFIGGGFGHSSAVQSQVPYLEDIGFPLAIAATALSSVALGSLIGKFSFGWLCDRMPAKYAGAIGWLFETVAIFILMRITPSSSATTMWLYAIIMGLGVGAWLPTMSMLVITTFGLTSYASIYGLISMAQSLGSAVGPTFSAYMFDVTGSYQKAFTIFLIVNGLAIPAILAIRKPKLEKIPSSE